MNLMLKGVRLVADCSDEEFKQEIDNLTDVSKTYVPKVIFEKPAGVSQQMQSPPGPWAPQIVDDTNLQPATAEAAAPSAGPQAVAAATTNKVEDDVEVLGSYQLGGSCGSGSSSSARATDTSSASVEQPFVEQPSSEFKLAGLNNARFLSGMDAFE